jgi:nitrate reductase NapE component
VIGRLKTHAQGLRQTLWALVVAPTAWALHFLFCYVFAAIACAKGGRTEMLGDVRIGVALATVVALAVVIASGFVAWAQSVTEGDPPPHQESTDEDRLRFLAVATLLLSGLSFIAILFSAIPAFVFEDCQ